MFSLFGWAGQSIFNELDARNTRKNQSSVPNLTAELASQTQPTGSRPAAANPPNLLQKIASMKYSPIREVSDAEYEAVLQERLLRLDAEIALLDEKIEMVKQEVEKEEAVGNGIEEKDQTEKHQQ